MEDYILNEETELSPAVVVTTILLIVAFALGIVYQFVGLLF